MGLFSKKTPDDPSKYHIPVEIVLMNFHDLHTNFVDHFKNLADAYVEADGATSDAVEDAVSDCMSQWEEVEDLIRRKLSEDSGYIREDAVRNGFAKYYDDYVDNRISMFRFTIGYRVMNAMISYCEERGIPLKQE